MKVALIGATGFVGKAILNELLDRCHDVVAIARDTNKIEIENDKLIKKAVDVLEIEKLAESLKGVDTVISAFNGGWKNPNLYADTIKGSEAIQQAVKSAGVNRYIFIGGAGSLKIDGHYLVDSPQFPEDIKPGATAVRDYFESLKLENDLDWVFFSPAIEMHQGGVSGKTGKYRLGKTSPVFNEEGRSISSVEDLAVAIVDETEQSKHHKEQFTAAY